MRLVAHDPHVADDDPAWGELNVAPRSLDALLEEADVVSLHVPLSEGTRNLIDAAALARMKPDAILINSARGGVVDEQALADALRSRATRRGDARRVRHRAAAGRRPAQPTCRT
jgi:(S)-sulfolactate dehydrogenase